MNNFLTAPQPVGQTPAGRTPARSGGDVSRLLLRMSIIAGGMAILAIVLAAAAPLAVWAPTLETIVLAAAICLAGALIGHVLSEFPRGNEWIMVRLVSSMMIRAGLPLLVVVVTKVFLPSVFSPGLVYRVVLFYLVGLIGEAVLSCTRLKFSR